MGYVHQKNTTYGKKVICIRFGHLHHYKEGMFVIGR